MMTTSGRGIFMRTTRRRMMDLVLGLGLVAGLLGAYPAAAQGLLNGYWFAVFDEDQPERGPGPDLGDYAGLPVTPAAISVAQNWDPEELTIPEEQCRTHPSLYGF